METQSIILKESSKRSLARWTIICLEIPDHQTVYVEHMATVDPFDLLFIQEIHFTKWTFHDLMTILVRTFITVQITIFLRKIDFLT